MLISVNVRMFILKFVAGHLITSINDIKILLMRNSSTKESTHGKSTDNKRLLVSLMEPTIEYIMKCIFKDASQVSNVVSMVILIVLINLFKMV